LQNGIEIDFPFQAGGKVRQWEEECCKGLAYPHPLLAHTRCAVAAQHTAVLPTILPLFLPVRPWPYAPPLLIFTIV